MKSGIQENPEEAVRGGTEKELRHAHEELEQRVMERTAELVKALKDLHQKEHMLLQQSRLAAMGEMISNIAHQWRQPLNSLGLNIQRLSLYHDEGKLSKEVLDQSVDVSMKLIQHMSQTIDDFRNFFKPDKEKLSFKASVVVANVIALITGSFNHNQITIDLECVDDPIIYGYQNEYSQVLLNILMNARDAFETCSHHNRRVLITTCLRKAKSVITICDNAGGIPADILEKVFDPYFTTKGPHGTGIGLFLAKNIIERGMHGRLTARNTGEGAEFAIEV
ncbi:sensor histidine kinase [Geotalea daltonii FRC-32]|uniref:histidine kinase n=1 Tax=Geotalea daltonii (strain DSM 22248 / JCM 15807 / FRC-32) TaxID=316067 RepID=B9M1U1_GEODF|nr:ATP-binding protein [Geotalea daltonii]ACM19237.1 sensor histidine kinase [Geotalea daltonii FRC-32]